MASHIKVVLPMTVVFKVILVSSSAVISNCVPSNICAKFASVALAAVVKQVARVNGPLVITVQVHPHTF